MEEEGVPLERPAGGRGWRAMLRKRLPVLAWGAAYDRSAAAADLVAGLTLGLTLVPQSIAYASLANLPLHYGLYSSYVGTILYAALGTVKEVSIGPTSLMALLTLQLCRDLPVQFVVLLSFLSGCIVLLMGVLRLAFLVELISPAVTSGFTSATAAIIVVSQLKGLLGLSFAAPAESAADNVRLLARHWRRVRLPDAALGLACCAALLALRKLKDVRVSPKRRALRKALWLVCIGRNALVVLGAAAAAYVAHQPHQPLFKLSGRVEAGVPQLSLPPFSATVGNATVGFVGMVRRLGCGLFMMPLVMVLANIAIAKAFSVGGRVDATQEMVTLGLCNIAGSLVHAMPTCGAFTRSAVSHSSGVRSPAAGLYSGIITLLALIFLTQYFYFIPKACLSSVLICAVIFMVDVRGVARLWRRDRAELAVCGATFVAAVALSAEAGVAAGALASLAALLRRLMRPRTSLRLLKTGAGAAVVVRPAQALCYLNAELVARRVSAALLAAAAAAGARPVLLDCQLIPFIDYSAQQVLERLVKKAKSSDQTLLFFRAGASIVSVLEAVEGIDPRPLRAATAGAALRAARPGATDDTAALLADEHGEGVENV